MRTHPLVIQSISWPINASSYLGCNPQLLKSDLDSPSRHVGKSIQIRLDNNPRVRQLCTFVDMVVVPAEQGR